MRKCLILYLTCIIIVIHGFHITRYPINSRKLQPLSCVSMSIDEIKAELDLRGVDYSECISKNDLLELMKTTRESGKADPSILNKFNQVTKESDMKLDELLDSDIASDFTAEDGSLPGGMSPQMMKALAKDPEILSMLQNPKMQEIMQAG